MKKSSFVVILLFLISQFTQADVPLNIGSDSANPSNGLGIVENVLATEGTFCLSDGASIFTFSKDGTFKMDPLGLSGRTIEGVWKPTGHDRYTIVGIWSWQNWTEDGKDVTTREKKRMVMIIEPGGSFGTAVSTNSTYATRVYQTYFCIDEVVKLTETPSSKPSN